MQAVTFTIKNTFGQAERRVAEVLKSKRDIPVGFGKIGEVNNFDVFANRGKKQIEFATRFVACKK